MREPGDGNVSRTPKFLGKPKGEGFASQPVNIQFVQPPEPAALRRLRCVINGDSFGSEGADVREPRAKSSHAASSSTWFAARYERGQTWNTSLNVLLKMAEPLKPQE